MSDPCRQVSGVLSVPARIVISSRKQGSLIDQLTASAEFTDLFRPEKSDSEPAFRVAGVLGDQPLPYPLLELGAGTGYATLRLAELLPAAEIVTVERSAAMRSVVNARLAAATDARHRVTVVADDFFGARLPPLWSAAIALHFVCQLSPPRRAQLWRMLAEHLAPDGIAILDRCFGPKSADAVPGKLTGEVTAGANAYQRWVEVQSSGPDSVRTTITYRTLRDGTVVHEVSEQSTHFVVTEAEILAEAAAAGLSHQVASDLLVLSHAAGG